MAKNFYRIMVTPKIGRYNAELDRGYRSREGPPPPPGGVLSAVISKKGEKKFGNKLRHTLSLPYENAEQ
jgi:hypothetical protein